MKILEFILALFFFGLAAFSLLSKRVFVRGWFFTQMEVKQDENAFLFWLTILFYIGVGVVVLHVF